jgi:hypothetical protein
LFLEDTIFKCTLEGVIFELINKLNVIFNEFSKLRNVGLKKAIAIRNFFGNNSHLKNSNEH